MDEARCWLGALELTASDDLCEYNGAVTLMTLKKSLQHHPKER